MIRGIIQSVVEGMIKYFSSSGREGESFTKREYFQHYGFTSRPLAGAEAIIIKEGNHIVMIASDDRRYRLAIEAGEVCLYTDEGDHIRFKRGMEIYVKTGNKLTVEATNEVDVTSPVVTVTSGTSVTVNTPLATINASTSCVINTPQLCLGGAWAGMRRFIDERFRALFNTHVHSGVTGGPSNTGVPTTLLEFADHASDKARGI